MVMSPDQLAFFQGAELDRKNLARVLNLTSNRLE
jgi:hypothetical protein